MAVRPVCPTVSAPVKMGVVCRRGPSKVGAEQVAAMLVQQMTALVALAAAMELVRVALTTVGVVTVVGAGSRAGAAGVLRRKSAGLPRLE